MNLRQSKLLEKIIDESQFVTADILAKYFSVSTKTIYNDINALNDFLLQLNIQIEKESGKGIRLEVSSAQKRAISNSLEHTNFSIEGRNLTKLERQWDIIETLCFKNKAIDILDWALDHFISEASIRRDIDELGKELISYGIQIVHKGFEYSMVGEEDSLRMYLRNFILRLINKSEFSRQNFSYLKQLAKIQRLIDQLSKIYSYQINEDYKKILELDILIASIRIRNGLFVSGKNMLYLHNIENYAIYPFASELLSKILDTDPDEILNEEIAFIAQSILSVGFETVTFKRKENVENIVDQFISEVSDLLELDLQKDRYLKQMLLNHIQPMIFRSRNKIKISNHVTEEIKSKYSILFNIVWLSSAIIEETYKLKLTEDEVAFLTIHFEIAIEKVQKQISVYVVCPYNLATSELLVSQIKKIIPIKDKIVRIHKNDVSTFEPIQPSLIISSVFLKNSTFSYIKVDPILKYEQQEEVKAAYNLLFQGNGYLKHLLTESSHSEKKVLELLGESIYLKRKHLNRHKALKKIISMTSDENRLSEQFVRSIYAREELGVTSTYTGIALPHAAPETVEKSELIITSLEKPIPWGTNLVKVIILIAIREDELDKYKDALIKIYSKIDSSEYVDKLWLSDSRNTFIRNMFSEARYKEGE